jgi:DNA-binding Lrp family transcriptional regulator
VGRGVVTAPPVPPEAIREHFSCRQDGEIIRRQCHIAALVDEPAVFAGPKGALMMRLTFQNKIRRVLASKVAWALAFGQWPAGPVRPKNGDPSDLRPSNLTVARYCDHKPQSSGGRASALGSRAEMNAALLNAMAEREGASVAELSRAVGLSEGRISTRLTKLAARGLCEGPMCVPGRAWCLSQQGRAIALSDAPVVLDDTDRDILRIAARSPMRLTRIAVEVGVCNLTARRRIDALIARGLVDADGAKFKIAAKGYQLLGDAVPKPWLKVESISAAKARDVAERSSPDGLTKSQAARLGGLARSRQMHGRSYALTG